MNLTLPNFTCTPLKTFKSPFSFKTENMLLSFFNESTNSIPPFTIAISNSSQVLVESIVLSKNPYLDTSAANIKIFPNSNYNPYPLYFIYTQTIETSTKYHAYRVQFFIESRLPSDKIITMFLEDDENSFNLSEEEINNLHDDPRASRGTVTTVQNHIPNAKV